MSTVSEWFGSAEKHQAQASAVIRQLALAGVAAIWVFRTTAGVAEHLKVPLALILLGLFLDAVQYVWLGEKTRAFARRHEVRRAEGDVKMPPYVSRVGLYLWWAKIASVLTATALLFGYLLCSGA